LKDAVDFLLKYDDFAQMRTIRPVTPYPGSPLYYDAIDKGLIKDVADFYENKHVNSDLLAANFTELSDEEFYESLTEANTTLLTNYYDMAKQQAVKQVTDLYKDRQVGFRGFRQI
jgi:anaerobic magnesium-protoporphyrin IX monomethyl ester cyclase